MWVAAAGHVRRVPEASPASSTDLTKCDEKGAVVFGHMPLLGPRKDGKAARRVDKDETEQVSSNSGESSSRGMLSASSVETASTAPTGITVPVSGTENWGDLWSRRCGQGRCKEVNKTKPIEEAS